MKKSTRIRPVVESLESMMLLSTAIGDLHPHALAPAQVQAEAPQPLPLKGTLKGTGTISGTSGTASGSGNLGSVGTASFKVSGSATDLPSSVTLTTKKGNLYLTASSSIVGAGAGASTTYTITGGTKAYADATGTGSVVGTYSMVKANKFSLTIKFS